MRTPTGEKPPECSVCGLKVSRHSLLTHQMRINGGNKSYLCSFVAENSILRQIYQHIWEVMVVRSHPHVLFVVKCYVEKVFTSHIWDLTWDLTVKKSSLSVPFEAKFSVIVQLVITIWELTLEKSHMNVLFVAKNLGNVHFLLVTWGYIVGVTHIYVLFWAENLTLANLSAHMRRHNG